MNGNVTANAFAACLKTQPAMRNRRLSRKSGVTLQTQLTAFSANQQHPIRTSMRIVAGDAAAAVSRDFSRRVFINEGSVLFDMARRACFRNRLDQIGRARCAMGIMAIRTLYRSLGNAMVHRQGELRLNRAVAAIAKLRL